VTSIFICDELFFLPEKTRPPFSPFFDSIAFALFNLVIL